MVYKFYIVVIIIFKVNLVIFKTGGIIMSERKEMAIAMLKDMPEEKISLKILLLIMTGN